jgi:outer membrane protein assembly factor BamB
MRFQIVVAPPLRNPGLYSPADVYAPGETLLPHRPQTASEVVDVLIDGANVTARVHETHGALVLRDLAFALVDMTRTTRGKQVVRFNDEPWELCIERFGSIACLSVYRAGSDPLIAAYDRAVPFLEVIDAVRQAIEQLLVERPLASDVRAQLAALRLQLEVGPSEADSEELFPEPLPVVVDVAGDAEISFGAEFAMRERLPRAHSSDLPKRLRHDDVERADVHALLFRGRLRAKVRARSIDLGEGHPVLFAERLLELARRAFDAWERGLALNARGETAGVLVGVRISGEGAMALTLGQVPRGASAGPVHTFPALAVADVLDASIVFGRSLVKAVVRRDPLQTKNLRLNAFRRDLRECAALLRRADQTDSKVNTTPESYRAYAASLDDARARSAPPIRTHRLRYVTRWRAVVPGLDLRATYLCGDRLVAGAATEMWALEAATGRVLWRSDVPRGASVVTPLGIVRLAADGTVGLYGYDTGKRVLRARIEPRVGGPMAGAVVNLPGLPRLVIVTEGEHRLVAMDLTTGEALWRWAWSAPRGAFPSVPRLKRAGKLVYFTCGDGALSALDVTTGALVWRIRDRLRFRSPPAVAHEALFAVSGGLRGAAKLHCVDPYSGLTRWTAVIAGPNTPCTVEGLPLVADTTVAVALRQHSGLSLAIFRRSDGSPIAERERVVAPAATSWLAVDDAFVGNTPFGELVAVRAGTGELAWRHVLGPRPLEADVPRRLEPVLRCGALFIPCAMMAGAQTAPGKSTGKDPDSGAGVCILRPSDGGLIGVAPSEAIPDLLRVDENCNIYVAEESGHLLGLSALPRLTLVR